VDVLADGVAHPDEQGLPAHEEFSGAGLAWVMRYFAAAGAVRYAAVHDGSSLVVSARAAGCDLAVVTTQPGSKSQQNVQRLLPPSADPGGVADWLKRGFALRRSSQGVSTQPS
jgi:hypothetical protein